MAAGVRSTHISLYGMIFSAVALFGGKILTFGDLWLPSKTSHLLFSMLPLAGSSCQKNTKVFMQIQGQMGSSQIFHLPVNIAGKERLQRGCTDLFLFKVPGWFDLFEDM